MDNENVIVFTKILELGRIVPEHLTYEDWEPFMLLIAVATTPGQGDWKVGAFTWRLEGWIKSNFAGNRDGHTHAPSLHVSKSIQVVLSGH